MMEGLKKRTRKAFGIRKKEKDTDSTYVLWESTTAQEQLRDHTWLCGNADLVWSAAHQNKEPIKTLIWLESLKES